MSKFKVGQLWRDREGTELRILNITGGIGASGVIEVGVDGVADTVYLTLEGKFPNHVEWSLVELVDEDVQINPVGGDQTYRKDAGKLPVGEIFKQFPLALEELAKVIAFGEAKYKRHSWPLIQDFKARAENSLARHELERAKGNSLDEESGCHHMAHSIWNLLAMLQNNKLKVI